MLRFALLYFVPFSVTAVQSFVNSVVDLFLYFCATNVKGALFIFNQLSKALLIINKNYTVDGLQYSIHLSHFCGTLVYLQLFSSNSPVPDITWMNRKNQKITSGGRFTITDYDRRLVIDNTRPEDEGTYYCNGTNYSDNSGVEALSLYLNVTCKSLLSKFLFQGCLRDQLLSPHFQWKYGQYFPKSRWNFPIWNAKNLH